MECIKSIDRCWKLVNFDFHFIAWWQWNWYDYYCLISDTVDLPLFSVFCWHFMKANRNQLIHANETRKVSTSNIENFHLQSLAATATIWNAQLALIFFHFTAIVSVCVGYIFITNAMHLICCCCLCFIFDSLRFCACKMLAKRKHTTCD